jgi:hypothetical protein
MIETKPAFPTGTPRSIFIIGQEDPRRESGSPKLINAK